jgi:hypothetical protein
MQISSENPDSKFKKVWSLVETPKEKENMRNLDIGSRNK